MSSSALAGDATGPARRIPPRGSRSATLNVVFHVKHDETASPWAVSAVPLAPSQIERLETFEDLLLEVAVPRGFVRAAGRAAIHTRHVLDSLRSAPLLPVGRVADLGSGAGLPGIVVAVARPDLRVDLVEPMRRRQAFLELALERLGIENAQVLGERSEELPVDVYDGAVARAFAPAGVSWAVARRILRPGGRLVYFAGRGFDGRTPEGADVRVVRPGPRLESTGPLVIMTAR